MKGDSIKKYGIFLFALLVLVGADQWTKKYAEDRLATPGMVDVELEVGSDHDGATVEEFLTDEFRANSEEEIDDIASRYTTTFDGLPVDATTELSEGDGLRVRHRKVVVIEDYWDFQYTRNPGAAFGLFANLDDSFRKPFFNIVSLLALLIIIGMLRSVPFRQQQLMFWGLTLIAAGALGNFIDRLAYGYVIDFIVWKYTDDHRWPTFNVADAQICVGVALMVLEMIREGIEEWKEKKGEEE